VKLLLDTHTLLWWQLGGQRLSREARQAIATADIVWVSSATGYEVAIKTAIGKLRYDERLRLTLAADDFTELPITLRHTEELERLPMHHADPFDRILVAQARIEGATIVSHDRSLAPYGVPVIWT
jgi:PIN domain nuclease of toxin-antitoxin system